MSSQRREDERGSALLLALVILFVASSIGAAAAITAMLGEKAVRADLYREKAYRIAESGVEKALVEIVRDAAFAGEDNVPFDGGSFSTDVRAIGDEEREITSVGEALKGGSVFSRQRIVACVKLGPDQARIICWSESSLPIEPTGRDDER